MEMLEKFKRSEIIVHCEKLEQAKEFVKLCCEHGMKFTSSDCCWDVYCEETCYICEYPQFYYGNKVFFERECKQKIVSYEEFMMVDTFTLSDLSAGMLVKFRCGKFMIVYETKQGYKYCVYAHCGCIDLRDYKDDLTTDDEDYNIDEVYSLPVYIDGIPSIYEPSNRDLLWKREEFVEMSLEEVNELLKSLGQKPVKIIE